MFKLFKLSLLSIVLILGFTQISCNKYDGFKKDSSGFYYKHYEQHNDLPKPDIGDFVEINIAFYTRNQELSPMTLNSMTIDESLYRGDLYEALKKMHLGDSATFIFKGRKLYEEFLNMGDYPYGNEPIFADVKMRKVMSRSKIELAEENYKENKKRMRQIEDSIILDYVVEHRIELKKNGIYRIVNRKTDGEKPSKGNTVEILYHSYFLDGREYESVIDPNNPCRFEIGKGQVALGVEEVIQEIRLGEDVTCVIPSRKAFGELGSEQLKIPPYTPMVYRIELLRILK